MIDPLDAGSPPPVPRQGRALTATQQLTRDSNYRSGGDSSHSGRTTKKKGIDNLQINDPAVAVDVHIFHIPPAATPTTSTSTSATWWSPRRRRGRMDHGSEAARWVGFDELSDPDLALDAGTVRMVRAAVTALDELS